MRLLDEWKEWTEQAGAYPVPPYGYLLGADCAILDKLSPSQSIIVRDSWTDVVGAPDFGAEDRTAFHLGLLPQPFMGDLKNAEIYLLTLNPGYSPTDYFGEHCVPGFRKALLRNLRQDHTSQTTPNLHLDPQYAWSGGYVYWHTRLSGIISQFASEQKWSYAKARSKLGEKLAIIELIPYHSASFNRTSLLYKLKSAELAKEFVEKHVAKRVENEQAIILMHRKRKVWQDVLELTTKAAQRAYSGGADARNPSFKPCSIFGKAILKQLRARCV